jgi:hypothetical protein
MLLRSQPLSDKAVKRLGLDNSERPVPDERNVISERIGEMFDDFDLDKKPSLRTRLDWKWRDIKGKYYDIKHTIQNHWRWHKTLREIRSWEGFSGMLCVMQTHLRDYLNTEEKYGMSEESYKDGKIASVKETLEILARLQEPDEYHRKLLDAVDARFPDYKSLITRYGDSSTSTSGKFVPQGSGWVGHEYGKDPREGYFEFVSGCFELAESPNQTETDRLLAELRDYHVARDAAYRQAEKDSEADFERLHLLLNEHLYTWWD